MATSYKAPAYDEAKYRKGIKTNFYTNAIKTYTAQAQKDKNAQIAEARKEQSSNLKSAYINRLQNEQKMNDNLARAGIRGGMTETSNMKIANQYGQERATANSNYANAVTQGQRNTDRTLPRRDGRLTDKTNQTRSQDRRNIGAITTTITIQASRRRMSRKPTRHSRSNSQPQLTLCRESSLSRRSAEREQDLELSITSKGVA